MADITLCPKCRTEYESWVSTCAECNIALIVEPLKEKSREQRAIERKAKLERILSEGALLMSGVQTVFGVLLFIPLLWPFLIHLGPFVLLGSPFFLLNVFCAPLFGVAFLVTGLRSIRESSHPTDKVKKRNPIWGIMRAMSNVYAVFLLLTNVLTLIANFRVRESGFAGTEAAFTVMIAVPLLPIACALVAAGVRTTVARLVWQSLTVMSAVFTVLFLFFMFGPPLWLELHDELHEWLKTRAIKHHLGK